MGRGGMSLGWGEVGWAEAEGWAGWCSVWRVVWRAACGVWCVAHGVWCEVCGAVWCGVVWCGDITRVQ